MTNLLQLFQPSLIVTLALVLPLITTDAYAQITVSVDDIDPWYGRTLTVISSQTDSLSDESVVHPILDAVGENATYDFRGITFAETFRGTMRYLRMTPDGPGGDVDHLLPSTTVMELSTELEEDVVQMIMWGFSEVRDDSVFQRGAILRYDLLVEMEGVESTADTMLFDPPTFSDPASYTYGDSWTAPSVLGSAFGDTEVEVVGYGTLITPRGQERQALRIERTTGTFGLEMKTIEFEAAEGPHGSGQGGGDHVGIGLGADHERGRRPPGCRGVDQRYGHRGRTNCGRHRLYGNNRRSWYQRGAPHGSA